MKDKYSIERIALLHPKARPIFTAFIEECENTFGITLRITMGLRTIEQQNALYAQGRNGNSGKIVTDAKGGTSYHNYGLAIDLCEMVNNDTEVAWNYDMKTLLPIALKHGEEWGGTWIHIKDYPHFELRFGFKEDCSDLLELVNQGKIDNNGYVIF